MKTLLFLLLITAVACQSPQNKNTQSSTLETEQNAALVSEDAVIFDVAVNGMTCTGCEQTITKSVESMDEVQWVKASHLDSMVTVALNISNPDTALVRQKITETGYLVVSIIQQADSIQ